MKLPRLINDNAPKLLETDNKVPETKLAENSEEFFKFLKTKVSNDFQVMLDTNDIDKKVNALADLCGDIDEYKSMLQKRVPDIDRKMKERNDRVGGLKKRIILEAIIPKPKWTEEDYQFVKKEGEEREYPVVNIGRDNKDQVYMTSLLGKESWEKQMDTRLSERSQDHFVKFVSAVRRKDYETETQK